MSDTQTINLAGEWQLSLDREDAGTTSGWASQMFNDRIALPGSLQEQGYGDLPSASAVWTGELNGKFANWEKLHPDIPLDHDGRFRSPYCLTPRRMYVGVAWYGRQITIPPGWAGRRVVLFIERAHWETTAFVDGRLVGVADALSAPHEHVLFDAAVPGPCQLALRVDNRINAVNVGQNSHSISDHTQGNWNGLAGRIELRATGQVRLDDVQLYPSTERGQLLIRATVGNSLPTAADVTLRSGGQELNRRVEPGTATLELTVSLPADEPTWDEFSPNLHDAVVELQADGHRDSLTVRYGLRDLSVAGTQLAANGRRIWLRGTLECCIFPLTGYPPVDVESWRRIIRICKAHGLNHIRFHSYCPPEAAFAAADELGFYYQVECSSWANQGATVGDGKPLDGWLYDEARRIVRAFGNHPSFLLMTYGNEPAGEKMNQWLGDFVNYWKQHDDRRLHTSGSGWPILPESDYHVTHQPRLHQWGDGLNSRVNARTPETVSDYSSFVAQQAKPVVSHEIGQWCVFPNLKETAKYTGWLQARNFELFAEVMRQNHLLDRSADFLHNSGKLQALCYKEEIEAALRTPGFGGFQLLDLHDFPGQGTALVGVLDPFWDEKGYITADEFSRFCAPIVPLARIPSRTFTARERIRADIDLYQFGPTDLADALVCWTIRAEDGAAIADGQFGPRLLPRGELLRVGTIDVPLPELKIPARFRLEVTVPGTNANNAWDIWVYPNEVVEPSSDRVAFTTSLAEAGRLLNLGQTVMLCVPPEVVRGDAKTPLQMGFTSVFWNTAWTTGQAPHTLGICCDPKHPAMALFPTGSHTDWQWWEPIHRAKPMILPRELPAALTPIVSVIDDWFTSRRLALVFEAKVGSGRLLVSSIDLTGDLPNRPAARQLRASLVAYAASPAFQPTVELSYVELASVLEAHAGV